VHALYSETARVASAYPNFLGWDLWSEPSLINWAHVDWIQNAQFCYCPATQARFREWLRAKYGSLDALNRAWHRKFASWDDIEPPRFSTILSYTDYIDWKTFIYDRLARIWARATTQCARAAARMSSRRTRPSRRCSCHRTWGTAARTTS
jgi:beta-galactosidase GanA